MQKSMYLRPSRCIILLRKQIYRTEQHSPLRPAFPLNGLAHISIYIIANSPVNYNVLLSPVHVRLRTHVLFRHEKILDLYEKVCYNVQEILCPIQKARSCCGFPQTSHCKEVPVMRHIQTIETRNLCESAKKGGCGECQTSCQSACKTSCGIANQQCESKKQK